MYPAVQFPKSLRVEVNGEKYALKFRIFQPISSYLKAVYVSILFIHNQRLIKMYKVFN